MAYSEQATEGARDLLTGLGQCETDDVLSTLWQIQLLNSQVSRKALEATASAAVWRSLDRES